MERAKRNESDTREAQEDAQNERMVGRFHQDPQPEDKHWAKEFRRDFRLQRSDQSEFCMWKS